MSEDKYTRITLRIPNELHKRIVETAEKNSNSLNSEIIHRLSDTTDMFEQIDPEMDHHTFKLTCIKAIKSMTSTLERIEEADRELYKK